MWGTPHYTSLPNSEDEAKLVAPQKSSRVLGRLRFTAYVSGVFLLLASLGINVWLLSRDRNAGTSTRSWSPIPELPRETVTFTEHQSFIGGPGPENDAAWANLITDAGTLGFTLVSEPEMYSLPPGMPYNGTTNVYGISMFHQLHCLRMLRNDFWSNGEVEGQEKTHVAHCFDYLRQGIMCAGDMTLEWANWEGKEPRIDGWGIIHRGCRSWEAVGEYMKEHDVPGYVET